MSVGKFILTALASCLGIFLAGAALVFIGSVGIAKAVASGGTGKKAKPNTVLELKLDEPIPEQTNNVPMDGFTLEPDNVLGLQNIKRVLEHAKTDDNIKGILLNLSGIRTGQATASVLRESIEDFRSEDKFVVAYSDGYDQGSYYIASSANKIFVSPIGGMDFRGFSRQIPFFKDMLDRLGINMQIYYAGQYKSATEPFRLNEMSEQSKLQTREYLEGMYQQFLEDISDDRNIPVAELRRIANEYLVRNSEDAVKYKLADEMAYYDQVLDELRSRTGLEDEDKIPTISLDEYAESITLKSDYKSKNKIAVIFAEGDIVNGKGDVGKIGGKKYADLIRKVRQDDKVKAIVMRINSGGGSALASDFIWRELKLAREEGIPVVASMGDLAASGGYYIACMADTILAEPNTITGSIGVFGMIPSLQKMMKDKAGISFDTVKTTEFATMYTPFFDHSEKENAIIQKSVEEFYEIFLQRVAEGRDMTRDEVHKVAQGRVWTGEKAKQLGLVDAFGDLDEAVELAAKMADLDNYRTAQYPKIKDPIQTLIEKLTGMESPTAKTALKEELSEIFPQYYYLSKFKNMKGVQARLPFFIEN